MGCLARGAASGSPCPRAAKTAQSAAGQMASSPCSPHHNARAVRQPPQVQCPSRASCGATARIRLRAWGRAHTPAHTRFRPLVPQRSCVFLGVPARGSAVIAEVASVLRLPISLGACLIGSVYSLYIRPCLLAAMLGLLDRVQRLREVLSVVVRVEVGVVRAARVHARVWCVCARSVVRWRRGGGQREHTAQSGRNL